MASATTLCASLLNGTRKSSVLPRLPFIISLDDFGVKESNLFRVVELPIDQIKIDRAFISGIDVNERKQKILESLAHLADGLKLEVVAEGVETQPESDFLTKAGITLQQGYLYGKAFNPAERRRD